MKPFILALWGTSKTFLLIGLGALGVRLKNVAGVLSLRNAADSADVDLIVGKVRSNADEIIINDDAANTGTDRKLTLARNPSGSAPLTVIFPAAKGTDGQAFRVKAGTAANVIELEQFDSSGSPSAIKIDETDFVFGTSSPATMFQVPLNQRVLWVDTIVKTAFDGTAPTASIGVSGTPAKYQAATEIDLKTVGTYRTVPGLDADGTAQDLIFTLAPDGSTAGAGTVEVAYAEPT